MAFTRKLSKEDKLEICRMRLEGATFQVCADRFGISKQRAQQIEEAALRKPHALNRKLNKCIYPAIRNWMIEQELTYAGMAKLCHVVPATIHSYLTGNKTPAKETIDRILAITGMTYEEAFRQ